MDWDGIERNYVDHDVERIGEPITPTRGLEAGAIEDILDGRPLADGPRTEMTATWKTDVPADKGSAAAAEGLSLVVGAQVSEGIYRAVSSRYDVVNGRSRGAG